MDERGLWRVAAYVELNPVKVGMVEAPWDYRWSRVQAHLSGKDQDGIIAGKRILELVGDWKRYRTKAQGYGIEELERPERTGKTTWRRQIHRIGGKAFESRFEVESNRLYNYGWDTSLREKWASSSYERYFQKVDKDVSFADLQIVV
jgi:hypothetical protein